MAAIHPSLLLKHFMPDLSNSGESTPRRQYVKPGVMLDPHLQRAADDAGLYLGRLSNPRCLGVSSTRS